MKRILDMLYYMNAEGIYTARTYNIKTHYIELYTIYAYAILRIGVHYICEYQQFRSLFVQYQSSISADEEKVVKKCFKNAVYDWKRKHK